MSSSQWLNITKPSSQHHPLTCLLFFIMQSSLLCFLINRRIAVKNHFIFLTVFLFLADSSLIYPSGTGRTICPTVTGISLLFLRLFSASGGAFTRAINVLYAYCSVKYCSVSLPWENVYTCTLLFANLLPTCSPLLPAAARKLQASLGASLGACKGHWASPNA